MSRSPAYGQSTVIIEGGRATGESYTIAHHLFGEDGVRRIMIASLRYLDTFTKIGDGWFFDRTEPDPRLERDTIPEYPRGGLMEPLDEAVDHVRRRAGRVPEALER